MSKDLRYSLIHTVRESCMADLRQHAPRIWPDDCPRCAARMEFRFRPGSAPAEARTLRACPACGLAIDHRGTQVPALAAAF